MDLKLLDEFNIDIRRLIFLIYGFDEKDRDFYRTKERILIVMDIDPLRIIKYVGPYLYKYRDEILSGSMAAFINQDFRDELAGCDEDSPAPAIIPKLKKLWNKISAQDQKNVIIVIKDLLEIYVDYIIIGDPSCVDGTLRAEIEQKSKQRSKRRQKALLA
jgi:hypothetical protein